MCKCPASCEGGGLLKPCKGSSQRSSWHIVMVNNINNVDDGSGSNGDDNDGDGGGDDGGNRGGGDGLDVAGDDDGGSGFHKKCLLPSYCPWIFLTSRAQ